MLKGAPSPSRSTLDTQNANSRWGVRAPERRRPLTALEALAARVQTPIDDVHDSPGFASAGLFNPHVPFDQASHLSLGIAAGDHAADELVMLFLGFPIPLGSERNDRQQILDLREHPLLDDLADDDRSRALGESVIPGQTL
jgi:hypothetical protein